MLNIALPKGRLGTGVYSLLSRIGYTCAGMDDPGRKLVVTDETKEVQYLLVKPSDVAIYVERGAADIGVVGLDVLLETGPDVYELLDLKLGVCRVVVAAQRGFTDDVSLPLRVATKYPNITRRYFDSINRKIEIIKLSGSIELAPILGLSDVIVDIAETGDTLRENNLEVVTVIGGISARLIANKSGYKFKTGLYEDISSRLAGCLE